MIDSLLMTSLLCVAGSAQAAGGDVDKGKSRSTICAACHGATGISQQDVWPNLAGQKSGYIVSQLQAYKSGARKDPVMEPVAKLLTGQEIADLAAYFAQQVPPEPQALAKPAAAVTHEKHDPD